MVYFEFMMTPQEVSNLIAKSAKEKRLALNLTQRSLSSRSGVSFGVLKKFERTGQISILSLLKLAMVLGCLEEFKLVFKQPPLENLPTLDAILKQKTRHRGRK